MDLPCVRFECSVYTPLVITRVSRRLSKAEPREGDNQGRSSFIVGHTFVCCSSDSLAAFSWFRPLLHHAPYPRARVLPQARV